MQLSQRAQLDYGHRCHQEQLEREAATAQFRADEEEQLYRRLYAALAVVGLPRPVFEWRRVVETDYGQSRPDTRLIPTCQIEEIHFGLWMQERGRYCLVLVREHPKYPKLLQRSVPVYSLADIGLQLKTWQAQCEQSDAFDDEWPEE